VPVRLAVGDCLSLEARTSNISQFGCLVVCAVSIVPKTPLRIQNMQTGEWAYAQVVRVLEATGDGVYEFAIELLNHDQTFWRDAYTAATEWVPHTRRSTTRNR
jgi:hypothetical protein